MVDLKKKDLLNIKCANSYNNGVYDMNVNSLSRIKYDKNKKILEPKIGKDY